MTLDQFTTIPVVGNEHYEESFKAKLMPLIFERLRDPNTYRANLSPRASAFGGSLPLGPLGRIIYSGVIANGRAAILGARQEAF